MQHRRTFTVKRPLCDWDRFQKRYMPFHTLALPDSFQFYDYYCDDADNAEGRLVWNDFSKASQHAMHDYWVTRCFCAALPLCAGRLLGDKSKCVDGFQCIAEVKVCCDKITLDASQDSPEKRYSLRKKGQYKWDKITLDAYTATAIETATCKPCNGVPATCTGTATNTKLTCDLDPTTDGSAACPAGCVSTAEVTAVKKEDDKMGAKIPAIGYR